MNRSIPPSAAILLEFAFAKPKWIWRSPCEPYEVWYPLLLLGVLDPVRAFSLLRTARRRYEEIELRQLRALDAR
jgi:hypothetical protein